MSEGEEYGAVDHLDHPGPTAAGTAIDSALDRGRLVSIVARCRVGEEETDAGSRHVLLKPDGQVIVHGDAGPDPIHRWTVRDDLLVHETDGGVILRPSGGSGGWQLTLERVCSVTAFDGSRGGTDDPVQDDGHGSLLERLLADPDVVEPGFEPLATERETPAGPIDLYGRDAEGRAVAVELKTDRAGPAAIGQLDRYVEALAADLHADAEVRGVLAAPSVTKRTRELLERRGYGFSRLDTEA